ncbi:MAG: YbjQ family protein [Candidatus Bathyarchaeota archaeon]|nr:YbjQ family protein [Candidatus Bathyarchaeota archaeon]
MEKAKEVGANAIVGMDVETSDIGQTNITLISATGTAVIIAPE